MLLKLHWQLAGHMYRSASPLVAAFTQPDEIHNNALTHRWKRYRKGPDWTGMARVSNFLTRVESGWDSAADRDTWRALQERWIHDFPVISRPKGQNVMVVGEQHMRFEERSVQGACSGSQAFFVQGWISNDGQQKYRMHTLHRTRGWVNEDLPSDAGFTQIGESLIKYLSGCTVHVRLVLVECPCVALPCAV